MARRLSGTVDLFSTDGRADPLRREWPDPLRFPLNQDAARVEDVVLKDLRDSEEPLLVTGFASLDRLIDFAASAGRCKRIRVVFGSEPFDSRREVFSLANTDLPQRMKEYWLDRGISVLLSGKLLVCIERLKAGSILARYVARSGWRLHAKIYVGDEAASVGSSNFTDPGFKKQLEANTRFARGGKAEESQRYEETRDIAEQFWSLGRDYNRELIELLEELLRLVPWQEAVARASAELLEGEWAQRFLRGEYLPGDATLWPSQRQGIAQALFILKERGSVLVADATGSGKTRAGVHLVGAKVHEIIASNRLRKGKALLICPPSVVDNWGRESALGGVQMDIYSHGSLSHRQSVSRDNLIHNLRRAQLLCVDEGHNFLNIGSNRTQELLRNMADHVLLFTATPINRSAKDLLRIADMLGADNLDDSTIEAFDKMLGAGRLSRTLSEEEIAQLRGEIAKFTVRRTKRMLNQLIEKDPDAYRDAKGNPCRFPKHEAQIYMLRESEADREKAARIRDLAGDLHGIMYFRREIVLPEQLRRRGVTEEKYLAGRLKAAKKLSQYMVMSSLRSSRAALIDHLRGTEAAKQEFDLPGFTKHTQTGDVIGSIKRASGEPPKNRLNIELPKWLTDPTAHRQACEQDMAVYREIVTLVAGMSDARERAKAQHLLHLSKRYDHVLAFDSRPITLAVMEKLLRGQGDMEVLVATGDPQSGRSDLLKRFSPENEEPGAAIGLCSDSVSEGVNLQRAQVVVHLDMPSVVRVAEQRVGRVDRLDSPYKKIYAWWPQDAEEFALQADERFIERYDTVDNLLGSNMPLPAEIRERSRTYTAADAIREFETHAGEWDEIKDAFSPVRELVSGERSLISGRVYAAYIDVKAHVLSRVSLVSATKPWAFFCTNDASGVPKWILIKDRYAAPATDLQEICRLLRERLGPGVEDIKEITPQAERILEQFFNRLSSAERHLLSPRKKRALEEMGKVLRKYLQSASKRQDQREVDMIVEVLHLLEKPLSGIQPDWEEVAARWLDLIRPVWYEKLRESRRKPLLLKDIRRDLIAAEATLLPRFLNEFARSFPAQRPPDERVVACIVGIA